MPRWLCWLTLGHDVDFDLERRIDVGGWWAYPCKKCGRPMLLSLWGGVDEKVEEREA
jgi:hypothetical protein